MVGWVGAESTDKKRITNDFIGDKSKKALREPDFPGCFTLRKNLLRAESTIE